MSEPIYLTIGGEPVAAGRPRFRNVHKRDGGSFVSAYTPADTRKFQTQARYIAQEQMKGRPPLSGALSVSIQVFLPVPKSMPKGRATAALCGQVRPTTRPDLDNYIKQLDSFVGILWHDDSQIVAIEAGKHFSDRPRMEIRVSEVWAASKAPKPAQPSMFGDRE